CFEHRYNPFPLQYKPAAYTADPYPQKVGYNKKLTAPPLRVHPAPGYLKAHDLYRYTAFWLYNQSHNAHHYNPPHPHYRASIDAYRAYYPFLQKRYYNDCSPCP